MTPMRHGNTQRTDAANRRQGRSGARRGFAALTVAALLAGVGLVWSSQAAHAADAIGTGHTAEGAPILLGANRSRPAAGTMDVVSEKNGSTYTDTAAGGYRMVTVDGVSAYSYCLEFNIGSTIVPPRNSIHSLQWPTSYASQSSNVTKNYLANAAKIQWIIENGANPNDFDRFFGGISAEEAERGVQLAIWHYTNGVSNVQSTSGTTQVFNQLVNGANTNATTAAHPAVNLSPSAADGAAGALIGPLKLDAERATGVTATLDPPTAGLTLTNKAGTALTGTLTHGTELYLRVAPGTPAGSVSVNVTGQGPSIMPGMTAWGYTGDQSRVVIPQNPNPVPITAIGKFTWSGVAVPVLNPSIGTTATNKADGTKTIAPSGGTVADAVAYKDLTPGTTYQLSGQLMDKATGQPVGPVVKQTFTPTAASGTVVIDLPVAATTTGRTLVAFETLNVMNGSTVGAEVATHKDLNSVPQTVTQGAPLTITTTAKDAADGDKSVAPNGKIVDVVDFTGLTPGTTYTLTGQLMDKATGRAVGSSATGSFTPTVSAGSVQLIFDVPPGSAGRDLVVFETLTVNGVEVGKHHDLTSVSQTVSIPGIGTTATNKADGTKTIASTGGTVADAVAYTGLATGVTYTMTGQLMDKTTGQAVGAAVTTTFTPTASNGTVVIDLPVAATTTGRTLVAFETVTQTINGTTVVVATHTDINSAPQTVTQGAPPPPITLTTTAKDAADGDKSVAPGGKVVDVVEYTGLTPGTTYTLTGQLMDKATGTPVGSAVTTTFTPTNATGSTELVLDVPADATGKTLVAYETLTLNGTVVGKHHDLTAVSQTVTVPKIGTTATNKADGSKTIAPSGGTVADAVAYTGLAAGVTYTLTGQLMDKTTGQPAGPAVTTTFTPTASNGTVTIDLPVAATTTGRTLVAFETVSQNIKGTDVVVAVHKDINDAAQTVTQGAPPPPITLNTTAKDAADGDKSVAPGGKVVDVVDYTGLTPGTTYTLTGQLMDKATGTAVGSSVTTTFTPTTANGSTELVLDVPADATGKTLVAYETLTLNGTVVGKHHDLTAVSQTVTVPKIGTTLTTTDGKTKAIEVGAKDITITLTDKIAYSGLAGGQQYTASGVLMDKATGASTGVTGSTTFTANTTGTGTVDVQFVVPVDRLAGKTLVAFETVTQNIKGTDVIVAIHKDINDAAQTVTLSPKAVPPPPQQAPPPVTTATAVIALTTTARDAADDDKSVAPGGKVIDVVNYTGLTPGTTYTLTGQLMDKATGTAVGSSVTTTFTPTTANGSTELAIDVPTSARGTTLVVFETLTLNGTEVGKHHDLNSAPQTVTVPGIGTTATAADGTSKTIPLGAKDATATVLDKVAYTGLAGGKQYTVSGVLMDKATGASTGAIASQDFTADASGSGTVTVTFSIPAALAGKTLVAFETMTQKINGRDVIVAEHRDINDAAQTVTVGKPVTPPKAQTPPDANAGTGTGWKDQNAGTGTGFKDGKADVGLKFPTLPALPMTGVAALTWQIAAGGLLLALLGGLFVRLGRRRQQ